MKKVSVVSVFSILLLAVLLAGSGCSGDNGSQASTDKPVKACELFTQQQIETIFGASVDTPPVSTHKEDDKSGFWMSMCNYFSPDTNLSAGFMVQPITEGQSIEDAFLAYTKSLEESLPDYTVKQVEGIGSKAIWNEEMLQLTIFDGAHMVIVTGGQKNWSTEEKLSFGRKLGMAVLEKI